MHTSIEPLQAFPYKPPTAQIRQKYAYIFQLHGPLPSRFFKALFDKVMAVFLLVLSASILFLLKFAFLIEGWLIPENKGPMFFFTMPLVLARLCLTIKFALLKPNILNLKALK